MIDVAEKPNWTEIAGTKTKSVRDVVHAAAVELGHKCLVRGKRGPNGLVRLQKSETVNTEPTRDWCGDLTPSACGRVSVKF